MSFSALSCPPCKRFGTGSTGAVGTPRQGTPQDPRHGSLWGQLSCLDRPGASSWSRSPRRDGQHGWTTQALCERLGSWLTELRWKCRHGHQEQSEAQPGRGKAGGHPSPIILLLPDLVPAPSCWQGQISAPPPLQELPSVPESTSHTSTFQQGNPGAAVAEVQPSPGGVEPELCLLLLGAGWTGPQGHLRVSLWAWRGARQAPLRAHDGGAVRLIHVPMEGWTSRSHPDDGHQGRGETASQP